MAEIGFISLFSGAGGLDIGLETAGLNCLYASDIDQAAYSTLVENKCRNSKHLQRAVIERADVAQRSGTQILQAIGAVRGQVPLLVGGPPCQSWSSAGHQKGWLDPRGQLFDDFVRLAAELDVRWLMFENVRGLLTARGPDGVPGSALALIRMKLLDAGFQTQVAMLNAADYGVPQRRVRLVVFGYRVGDQLALPQPTHSKVDPESRWVSMQSVLSSLGVLSEDELIRPNPKLFEQLVTLKPGSGVKSPGKSEATRPGGHWGYKQGAFIADTSLPARTVTANQQQDWIIDSEFGIRRLTPRECAALQTFPPDWIFLGGRSDQYRLIGNAVPPLLAHQLGTALLDHLARPWSGRQIAASSLEPLAPTLQAAIKYTVKEESRNGPSRRSAPSLRRFARPGAAVVGL
jgi:DNA (cytosine-5)-methyltransferase 1